MVDFRYLAWLLVVEGLRARAVSLTLTLGCVVVYACGW